MSPQHITKLLKLLLVPRRPRTPPTRSQPIQNQIELVLNKTMALVPNKLIALPATTHRLSLRIPTNNLRTHRMEMVPVTRLNLPAKETIPILPMVPEAACVAAKNLPPTRNPKPGIALQTLPVQNNPPKSVSDNETHYTRFKGENGFFRRETWNTWNGDGTEKTGKMRQKNGADVEHENRA